MADIFVKFRICNAALQGIVVTNNLNNIIMPMHCNVNTENGIQHTSYSIGSGGKIMRDEWRLDGKLHNDDGPAIVDGKGQDYFLHGKLLKGGKEELESLKALPNEIKTLNMLRTGNIYGIV